MIVTLTAKNMTTSFLLFSQRPSHTVTKLWPATSAHCFIMESEEMQSPKRCRVSSRETEEICSQSPISKDSCSDNSSHEQEIDYDELSEEELHGLHVQSWKLFSHVHCF